MLYFRLILILTGCVVLCSLGVFAQESGTLDENGTVHGYIVDTTPAQLPIVGVRVQIVNERGHIFETRSAITGEFKYAELPVGNYLMNIHKAGYQRRIGKPVSVTNGGVHFVSFTMNKSENIFTGLQNLFRLKEPQGGTLQLQITTQFPQPAPIENAEVKIHQIRGDDEGYKTEITGTFDVNAQYRRNNLLPGDYLVQVGKVGYHIPLISMTVEENRITTAAVKFPISHRHSDTDILPSQKIGTKCVIHGKIFDTNFQQTPVSGVEVEIGGANLKQPMVSLSNADGEYEFVLPLGHYRIFLDKEGYRMTISLAEVTAESRYTNVTVIKEGMFIVYEAVAKGNVLELKHGISKERFSERYGKKIRQALFYLIIGGIAGGIAGFFTVRFLNKRQQ